MSTLTTRLRRPVYRLRRLAAAALVAVAGLAAQPAAAEMVFHRGNGSEPETLDPHKSSGVPDSYIQFDLFDGLVVPDGGNGQVPGAAESWSVSPDGLVYTFKLRANGKWSDGTPVTAEDWVFSWKRIVDPKIASKYSWMLWPVKNAKPISEGKAPLDQLGVKAVDATTFQVTLEQPTPYFVSSLTHHSTYAISKANYEKFGEDYIKPGNLVSNGAYMLKEAIPQGHVKVVKNPHHHDAANTKIDTVYFYPTENLEAELKRFRSGELHFTYEIPVSQMGWVRQNMADQMKLAPYFGTYFYAMNMTKEPWKSNKDLRLAVNLAVDRQAITEKIMQQGQIPAYSWVPPNVPNYTQQVPEYATWTQEQREAKAKELVQKAGYGPGGKPLEIEILFNTSENHRKTAIAVASMLQKVLGAKVVLNNQEWKVFLSTRDEKQFKDIVRHGWIGDYVDPNNFLELLRSDVGKQNPSGYANKEFDRVLSEANATMDVEKRRALLEQAEKIALDDIPIIPLYFYVSKHMISPKVVGWKDSLQDYHPSRWLSIKE
ncbi:MAG TPA: peptide ABC transporter substrate-binding protein [Azospirillaceae bacterium]|nr:peptide ABC transporter substrate-binding protein [Azospirillaceae bacterium]